MISGGIRPTPPVRYLFIDGACLNHVLTKIGKRYFGDVTPVLDWRKVRGDHRKVYYYDAIPVQRTAEDETSYAARVLPKRSELREIERQSFYHVRTGEAHQRQRRGHEQKMVDVQLSVDTLLMASRGLFSACSLIMSDLDFKPLLTALVEMGIDVRLLYADGDTNDDLKAVADIAEPLTINMLQAWFSDTFQQASLLPKCNFSFQSETIPACPKIVTWNDTNYGHCYITCVDDIFELVTNRCPQNPQTHRLQMSSSNKDTLRAYAKDMFNIDAPEY